MKKVNLLSKAEMRKVMGGNVPSSATCLAECSTSGTACKLNDKDGTCTFYAPSPGCPDGEYACIIPEA